MPVSERLRREDSARIPIKSHRKTHSIHCVALTHKKTISFDHCRGRKHADASYLLIVRYTIVLCVCEYSDTHNTDMHVLTIIEKFTHFAHFFLESQVLECSGLVKVKTQRVQACRLCHGTYLWELPVVPARCQRRPLCQNRLCFRV